MTAADRLADTDGLVAEDLVIQFGAVRAVDSFSFAAKRGEVTGLIGPNGAGKSTTLGALSGLLRPRNGTISVAGRPVVGQSARAIADLGVARSFQAPQLVPELTVREHIVMAHVARQLRPFHLLADMLGVGRRASTRSERAFADGLLEEIGLGHVSDVRAEMLSLGLRRLVEVAQCLARDPQFLLLDEPSAGLNAGETDNFSDFLRKASAERGIGIVLVEHDVPLVLNLSSYVYVLDFGHLIAEGTPSEIRENDMVRKAYLGQEVSA